MLENNTGILITVFSLIFTMRNDIYNRYEKKIYGIPQNRMQKSKARESYYRIRCVVYVFPFMILFCVNMDLCLAGYAILAGNFAFLYTEYWLLGKSFDREKDEEKVIRTLLQCMEKDKNNQEQNLQGYQTLLYDVMRAVHETEGLKSAESLYDKFIRQLLEVDIDKSFIYSYNFVRIIFCSREYLDEEMLTRCVKHYVEALYGMHEEKSHEKATVIFMAILKCATDVWDAKTMEGFLKWFLDFTNRSNAIRQQGINKNIYLLQMEQSAVVLLMLEDWLQHALLMEVCFEPLIAHLWDYGKRVFENEQDKAIEKSVLCYMNCLKYDERKIMQYLKGLEEDSRNNRGRSIVGLIKNRQKRYEQKYMQGNNFY